MDNEMKKQAVKQLKQKNVNIEEGLTILLDNKSKNIAEILKIEKEIKEIEEKERLINKFQIGQLVQSKETNRICIYNRCNPHKFFKPLPLETHLKGLLDDKWKYIAQDKCGEVYLYSEKPHTDLWNAWRLSDGDVLCFEIKPYSSNWSESLREL